jgi:hypothetical protein
MDMLLELLLLVHDLILMLFNHRIMFYNCSILHLASCADEIC